MAFLWLLFNGCVKIPEYPVTVGMYNASSGINTECIWDNLFWAHTAAVVPEKPEVLESSGFKLLNWNSYKGSKKGWQEDFERLSGESDIVTLQEGYLTNDLEGMLNAKRYSWDIANAFTYYDIHTGVLTASRVKPDFLCTFRTREPLSGIPKTVLITRYALSGSVDYLLLANIHMINVSLDIDAYRAQLEHIAEVLSMHQGPLIISGDFNSWSDKRSGILEELAGHLELMPVSFEADHRVTFMGRKVDHIFYRGLIPLNAYTEKVETSDHNPMFVTFRLADNV